MPIYIFEQKTMDEDKMTDKENKENKENSDMINKMYSNDKISKKEHNRKPTIEDDGQSKRYIKEMYEFADKNEFKTNIIFLGSAAVIVVIIIFSILMNNPFAKSKTNVASNKAVTKNTANTTPTKSVDIKPIDTQSKIFEYLNIEANRTSVLKKAVDLNKGSKKGVTIYLLSEILRANDVAVPASTSSVEGLMKSLTSMGWKKNTDFTQLKKGDICFTTDVPKKTGVPSHSYIFMSWVVEGKTDYANICDGQIEEYSDMLHKRNLSVSTTSKDKFSFFLRK